MGQVMAGEEKGLVIKEDILVSFRLKGDMGEIQGQCWCIQLSNDPVVSL